MASSATGWASEDARRPLFADVACKNLEQQVEYYTKHFGMKVRAACGAAALCVCIHAHA